MKKLSIIAIGLLSSSLGFAAGLPQTSDIPLPSVVVAPSQTGEIPTNKLVKDVPYDVYCTISSNGIAQQDFDAVKVSFNPWSIDGGNNYLNGVMRLPAKGYALKGLELIIPMINNAFIPSLEFMNLDDTDTVTVTNCVAKVHVSSTQK